MLRLVDAVAKYRTQSDGVGDRHYLRRTLGCVLEGRGMVKWREFLTFSVLGEVFICRQADSGAGGCHSLRCIKQAQLSHT